MSINMEGTFRGNLRIIVYPSRNYYNIYCPEISMQLFDGIIRLVYPGCTAHTRSKNMEATFIGYN